MVQWLASLDVFHSWHAFSHRRNEATFHANKLILKFIDSEERSYDSIVSNLNTKMWTEKKVKSFTKVKSNEFFDVLWFWRKDLPLYRLIV